MWAWCQNIVTECRHPRKQAYKSEHGTKRRIHIKFIFNFFFSNADLLHFSELVNWLNKSSPKVIEKTAWLIAKQNWQKCSYYLWLIQKCSYSECLTDIKLIPLYHNSNCHRDSDCSEKYLLQKLSVCSTLLLQEIQLSSFVTSVRIFLQGSFPSYILKLGSEVLVGILSAQPF